MAISDHELRSELWITLNVKRNLPGRYVSASVLLWIQRKRARQECVLTNGFSYSFPLLWECGIHLFPAELAKRIIPMKILKLFMVTLLLSQITGCVSVERPAEKEKEKEKIIVVPEKDSDRNY